MIGPFIDTLIICTMTGLVILTTGVWHDKEEQTVEVNEQAAVEAVLTGAEVLEDGVLAEETLAVGRFEVLNGRPRGFVPVRNHATVEDALLMLRPAGLVERELVPFHGVVVFPADAAGELVSARLERVDGRAVEGTLVLEGRAMQNGSPLTAWAFRRGLEPILGGYGHLLVTMAVFLFGLSTAISWSYYGDRSILYLAGPRFIFPYRIVFCIMHFAGAVYSLELVWSFGDMALGLMTIPNLLSILLLTGLVKRWTRDYVAAGKLEPPRRR
jgi:AGCS family alanine or glycine:cation symporter